MSKIRVLVVDDSAVVRRLLSDILAADPQLELVGAAPNAALAIARIQQDRPDVVTLDVEMPDVSGLELLVQIRKIAPRLPVIMFSALTQRAAAITLEALALGASDYVTKPSGTGSRDASVEQVRSELLPKIKALARSGAGSQPAVTMPERAVKLAAVARPRESIAIVAIGCSTGGPNALATLFREIPASFPLPIVIVQHMPPLFTRLLAERLTKSCPLKFSEASDGDVLEPGQAWIAPGDRHLTVRREGGLVRARLTQEAQENSCRPAVDVLFRSVASTYGAHTLAIMLTGMGQDGLRGCESIYAAGGQILTQDEASSVVWGMPGFVARAGLADDVLPLPALAAQMIQRASRATKAPAKAQAAGAAYGS